MTLPEAILERLSQLSQEDQKRVLEFVERLPVEAKTGHKIKNPWGLFSDRGIRLSAEEIDEARREMWSNFPRELPE